MTGNVSFIDSALLVENDSCMNYLQRTYSSYLSPLQIQGTYKKRIGTALKVYAELVDLLEHDANLFVAHSSEGVVVSLDDEALRHVPLNARMIKKKAAPVEHSDAKPVDPLIDLFLKKYPILYR
jgi:hypothetical protein